MMPRGRRPADMPRLGHGRYAVPGHRESCNGHPVLSIRMHEGLYRVAHSCACGRVREVSPEGYATLAEVEAVLGPGWWR